MRHSSTLAIEVEIVELSRAGAGIAKAPDGKILFVPLTAPGDRAKVCIVEEEKRYAIGEVEEILAPSPSRVPPRCPVFGSCGGCSWQHLPYETQWKAKRDGSLYALARASHGKLVPKLVDEHPAANPWNYRNRIQLRGKGREIGFFRRGSRILVPIESCAIARPAINAAIGEAREKGAELGRAYKVEIEVTEKGVARMSWNTRHAASGFRQVNTEANAELQLWVSRAATPGTRVLDLYGGDGNLSRGLAAGIASSVICVDRFPPAESVRGVEWVRGDACAWLAGLDRVEPTTIITDPPRLGMGDSVGGLAENAIRVGAREWLSIGCDPDKWARDLLRLSGHGWTLDRVAIFDFFPQTPHVECAARLVRG